MSRNEPRLSVKGEVSRCVLTCDSTFVTSENAKFHYQSIAFPLKFINELSSRYESDEVREKCSDGINSRHVRQEQSNKN